ncbi:alpha/beta hydrolase [Trinickia violacea]|uniref:Alpha/beta hydrolase n=1 Tax=Trinickia violacea TaxID=2571746 RepID=A0A4P8IMP3_9BURK|nr:alpha/beta hydrolase [Trinickia violacea]QCP50242.1 alpha/beta hydrolase [Trinickia violacea]
MGFRPDAQEVVIPAGGVRLQGTLTLPPGAVSLVLVAHGSGSSRHSPRNRYVAAELNRSSIGTLLMDLLSPQEDTEPAARFDIDLLAARLAQATGWVAARLATPLPLGYFGASTGAAAAIRAANASPIQIRAIVSRGGRPDMAEPAALATLVSPILLIVGGLDTRVIELNRAAFALLRCPKELVIVPGATHLFEEPDTLEAVARLAVQWFERYLGNA